MLFHDGGLEHAKGAILISTLHTITKDIICLVRAHHRSLPRWRGLHEIELGYMGVVKRPNTTAMIMQGLCLQSRMGQGKSVHPPALLET